MSRTSLRRLKSARRALLLLAVLAAAQVAAATSEHEQVVEAHMDAAVVSHRLHDHPLNPPPNDGTHSAPVPQQPQPAAGGSGGARSEPEHQRLLGAVEQTLDDAIIAHQLHETGHPLGGAGSHPLDAPHSRTLQQAANSGDGGAPQPDHQKVLEAVEQALDGAVIGHRLHEEGHAPVEPTASVPQQPSPQQPSPQQPSPQQPSPQQPSPQQPSPQQPSPQQPQPAGGGGARDEAEHQRLLEAVEQTFDDAIIGHQLHEPGHVPLGAATLVPQQPQQAGGGGASAPEHQRLLEAVEQTLDDAVIEHRLHGPPTPAEGVSARQQHRQRKDKQKLERQLAKMVQRRKRQGPDGAAARTGGPSIGSVAEQLRAAAGDGGVAEPQAAVPGVRRTFHAPVTGGDAFAQQKRLELDRLRAARAGGAGEQPAAPALHHPARHGQAAARVLQQQAGGGAAGQQPGEAQQLDVPIVTVIYMTIGMAAAAGLGALPFFFVRSLSRRWGALATAIACGVMFAASFDLIHEGQPYGYRLVVMGMVLGGIFVRWSQSALERYGQGMRFEKLRGSSARKTVLIIGIMAAHALGEGAGVGVSFCGERGWAQGVLTTLAIGIHNVPEGLAKATVLVSQGVSARGALLWSVLTCLPQPLVAVPSFIFVETFKAILPIALGFAGGCMIWMVFAELLPDAFEEAPKGQVATAATLSAAALEGFRMACESLETIDGNIDLYAGDIGLLGPGLVVALSMVAAAGAAGAAVGRLRVSSPVALGLSATLSFVSGAGALLSLLRSPGVPAAHTLSCAIAGGAAVLLLRRQLLRATASHAHHAAAHAKDKDDADVELASPGSAGASGGGHHADELAAYATSGATPFAYQQRVAGWGDANGHGAAAGNVFLQRSGGSNAAAVYESSYGGGRGSDEDDPAGKFRRVASKSDRRLAGPQQAAAIAAVLALAAHAVPQGWMVARAMLGMSDDMVQAALPAALLSALRGAAAGALAPAALGASGSRGAELGFAVGGAAALAALSALLLSPADLPLLGALRRFDYPQGLTQTLDAATAGGLCMVAFVVLAVSVSIHARRTRGGLLLGLLTAGAAHGLATVLCTLTPYCLRA